MQRYRTVHLEQIEHPRVCHDTRFHFTPRIEPILNSFSMVHVFFQALSVPNEER